MLNRWRQIAKNYWIAVQRSGKDARARRFVIGSTIKIVVAAGYLFALLYAFLVWAPSQTADNGTGPAFVELLVFAGVAQVFYIIYSKRNRPALLGDALRAASDDRLSSSVQTYLAQRMAILAALVVRSSNEIALRQNTTTVEHVAKIREHMNSELQMGGLWDQLEPQERELSACAGGNATDDQLNLTVARGEQLRLLRWVLRIDQIIVPLAHLPQIDMTLMQRLTPPADTPALKPSDVRLERDLANAYSVRLLAEQRQRGLLPAEVAGQIAGWADQVRQQSVGASRDYVVGTKTVEELDNTTLIGFTGLAMSRCQYAAYLVDQLSADQPIRFINPMAPAQPPVG